MTEALNEKVLEDIQKLTNETMNASHKALIDQAQQMADSELYTDLTDYCYEQVAMYIDNPEDLKKILTDPNFTETIFNTIAEKEEFKEYCREELRAFPRVILMTVVTGCESQAAHNAAEVLKDDPVEAERLNTLADLYQKHLQDALSYGKGEDKKVVFTGERNQ